MLMMHVTTSWTDSECTTWEFESSHKYLNLWWQYHLPIVLLQFLLVILLAL